jgi:hypothetical protein
MKANRALHDDDCKTHGPGRDPFHRILILVLVA